MKKEIARKVLFVHDGPMCFEKGKVFWSVFIVQRPKEDISEPCSVLCEDISKGKHEIML